MTEHTPAPACAEGDDIIDDRPAVFGTQPIVVHLYGKHSVNAEFLGIGVSGENALKVLAQKLFVAGFAADRELRLIRGGEEIGRTTVAEAAGVGHA